MEEVVETGYGQGGFWREWRCLGAACFRTAPQQFYVGREKHPTLLTSPTMISITWNRLRLCSAVLLFFWSTHSPFHFLFSPQNLHFFFLLYPLLHWHTNMDPFKPTSDPVTLLLTPSRWHPLSLRSKPPSLLWPYEALWSATHTPPHPTDGALFDLSPAALAFVTFTGILALPWKYRACSSVRAFVLAILLLGSFPQTLVWLISDFL